MADRRSSDSHLLIIIYWLGAVFIALAILGYFVEPRLYVIWLIFAIFGVASVPQGISIARKEHGKRYGLRGR